MDDIYYPVAHRSQEEIDASKNRYDEFDESLIPQIFESALHLKALTWMKPTSWSTTHVIYFVTIKDTEKQLVLRANTGKSKNHELYFKVEQLITDQVAKLDVPVNKIIYVDVSRKRFSFDYQIQEKLEGNDIEGNFKGSQSEYDHLSFTLGSYIAKMSRLTFDGFGRFDGNKSLNNKLIGTKKSMYEYVVTCLDPDLAFLADQQFIPPAKADLIRKLFEEYKPVMSVSKGSIVQHDLADHNMFFKNNKITGIYDWEACVSADSMLDLASAPTWKTHYPREHKLIEGYKSIKNLPENYQEKINIYRLRTGIWKAVFALRSDFMNEFRRQKFFDALHMFKIL